MADRPSNRATPIHPRNSDRRDSWIGTSRRGDCSNLIHRGSILPATTTKNTFRCTMALPYHLYVISTQVPGMPSAIQYELPGAFDFGAQPKSIGNNHPLAARARRQW